MTRRTSIMLDDDLVIELRQIQAKQIRETQRGIKFSQVVNEVLKQGFKEMFSELS